MTAVVTGSRDRSAYVGGRRLVTGQQQGQRLVANLFVGEADAFVASRNERRDHVVGSALTGLVSRDDSLDGAAHRFHRPTYRYCRRQRGAHNPVRAGQEAEPEPLEHGL